MSRSQADANQLKWLADAIINEMEKPDDEIDWEFIEICEELTKIFLGEKQLSEEEISSRISIIKERSKKFKTVKIKRQIKSILVATVAAAIFIFSSITVYAITPIKDYIIKAFQSDAYECGEENDTNYSSGNSATVYTVYLALEDYLNESGGEICYPEYIPYNADMIKIIITEADDSTAFIFNNSQIAFNIYHNRNTDISEYGDAKIIEHKNRSFYIRSLENTFTAYFTVNNDLYTIKCDSESELINMIYGINFGTEE